MTQIPSPATQPNDQPLVPLSQAHDASRYGGKASTLARLTAAGIPVPAGLVVPADLPDDQLPQAAGHICVWAAPRAHHGLIARSSAANEDGTLASFAGLYASRFTAATPDPLRRALREVRASATSASARTYGQRHGIDTHNPPQMAVLIQPALRPHASGVLAAQITRDRATRWCIEATYGLAEALLSGTQAGDTHTGDHNGEQTTVLADKPLITLPAGLGELDIPPGEWITLPTPAGHEIPAKLAGSVGNLVQVHRPAAWDHRPALTPDQRDRLLRTAEAAAATLALANVDIEWVLDVAGYLWLVQARPLTAPMPNPDTTAVPASDQATWQGIPASPGIGVGPAVHLHPGADPEPDRPAGNVLLCGPLGPEAVPALLASPAAVISTTGGPLSHTAIIARELGIPCVTAVTNAMTSIPPGATTRVDGTNGTVTLNSAAHALPAPAPADLSGVAVLQSTRPATSDPIDGRGATLLLHSPDDNPETALAALAAPSGTPPTGVLQPVEAPAFPQIPGYDQIVIPNLGRLLWPTHCAAPTRIVAVDADRQILHERTTRAIPLR